MPEGPQVARYARLQREKLVGRTVRFDSPNGRSDEVAAFFDGATLRGIVAVGKHLVYDFGEDRYLHVHLGRFGSFGHGTMPLPEVKGVLRLRLYTDAHWYELRGAIAIEIFDDAMRALLENRIGPNPLDPAADLKLAFAKIAKSKTAIGLQMMDQSIVAGIGNIYRSEVLFLNGTHPRNPGTSLSPKTWRAMWKDFVRLMLHGADVGRIVTTYPADRSKPKGAVRAEDRFYVYHRTAQPCRRCGTPIRTMLLGNRSVFWCPQDQPELAVDAASTDAKPSNEKPSKNKPSKKKSSKKKSSKKKSSKKKSSKKKSSKKKPSKKKPSNEKPSTGTSAA